MAGQVYFFNMTNDSVSLFVNGFNDTNAIAALPSSAPYTPNYNKSTTYTRYNTSQPQHDQIGSANKLQFTIGDGGDFVKVDMSVAMGTYHSDRDMLVYVFENSIVVMCPEVDNNAYLGKNGSQMQVDPGSDTPRL